jgi:rod shape-determining protein MreC
VAVNRARRRSVTIIVASAILIGTLYVSGGIVSGLRSAANLVVAPFSFTINVIARPIGHLFAGTINYSDVVAQNQRLRYELSRDQLQIESYWGMERQLSEVSTNLNVPFVGNLTQVTAQVVGTSPTNFSATVDIDKGRDDGVLAGMPVVGSGGLVGIVKSTTPRGATVLLITDVTSALGATFGTNNPSIIVTGNGVNNGLAATSVPLSAVITPNTQLFTDGLNGGLYPEGIPVARVKSVTLTPGAATYDLKLEPDADLRHLSYVDVLLWEPTP